MRTAFCCFAVEYIFPLKRQYVTDAQCGMKSDDDQCVVALIGLSGCIVINELRKLSWIADWLCCSHGFLLMCVIGLLKSQTYHTTFYKEFFEKIVKKFYKGVKVLK